jgi:hypothetical protein
MSAYMSNDLKNLSKYLDDMVDAQKINALKAGKQVAVSLGAKATISNDRYLDVEFDKQDSAGGVIDLKNGFEHGNSVRKKAKGGWYTIVPISYKVNQLSHSAYQQVKQLRNSQLNSTYIDILYGGKQLTDSSLSEFGITEQIHGGNLTRISEGATRGAYFAFRTVSDKSDTNSWLLLRDRAKAQAKENEQLRQIGEAINDTLLSYGQEV